MKNEVLLQAEFMYDEETFAEAVFIMEKTSFKVKRLVTYITFCVLFVVPCAVVAFVTKDYYFLFFSGLFALVAFLLRGTFCKQFAESNAPQKGQKDRSPSRTLTVYADYINIRAQYQDHNNLFADLDKMEDNKERKEAVEELSNLWLPLKDCVLYETTQTVMLYESRDKNQAILKQYFSAKQLELLRRLPFKKYKIIDFR